MVECLTMVDGRWGDLLDAERPPAKIGGDGPRQGVLRNTHAKNDIRAWAARTMTLHERKEKMELKLLQAEDDRLTHWDAPMLNLSGGIPLLNLPSDLQLLAAAHVAAPRDRAALCIAVPPLGRKAIEEIPALYRGPLMSLGNRVLSGGALSEAEVRRYVREFAPSEAERWSLALNECAQLNAIAAPSARVRCVAHPHPGSSTHLQWRLESGALLRSWQPFAGVRNSMYTCLHVYCTRGTPGVHHYEGAAGAERLVALAFADGHVHGFVGERGAELVWNFQGPPYDRCVVSAWASAVNAGRHGRLSAWASAWASAATRVPLPARPRARARL